MKNWHLSNFHIEYTFQIDLWFKVRLRFFSCDKIFVPISACRDQPLLGEFYKGSVDENLIGSGGRNMGNEKYLPLMKELSKFSVTEEPLDYPEKLVEALVPTSKETNYDDNLLLTKFCTKYHDLTEDQKNHLVDGNMCSKRQQIDTQIQTI